MSKFLFAVSLMGLLACGSGESEPGAAGGGMDTPPVSAETPSGDDATMEAPKGEQADLGADAAVIKSCIGLVASGDFEDALPVCLEAASIDADNANVQAALAKAQAATKEAATGAATDAAADAAAGALGGIGN